MQTAWLAGVYQWTDATAERLPPMSFGSAARLVLVSRRQSPQQRGGRTMPKPYPCLWFNGQASEAAEFYVGVFPNSRIDKVTRSASDTPSGKKGGVLTVDFTLDGQRFVGLDGGPEFTFDEAISFVVDCPDQAEVDRYWDALVEGGGEHGPCGWLKDRFGVSWQVVPERLYELLEGPDEAASERAMKAMLQMGKIDLAEAERAYAGDTVPAS
jgi:predicted 3-demethylubiquinone-9 3-methyltransferase (glyoxalase superfamily)